MNLSQALSDVTLTGKGRLQSVQTRLVLPFTSVSVPQWRHSTQVFDFFFRLLDFTVRPPMILGGMYKVADWTSLADKLATVANITR